MALLLLLHTPIIFINIFNFIKIYFYLSFIFIYHINIIKFYFKNFNKIYKIIYKKKITFAKRVFPVPGGPVNNAPLGILAPKLLLLINNFFIFLKKF